MARNSGGIGAYVPVSEVIEGLPFYAAGDSYIGSDVSNTPGTRYVYRLARRHGLNLTQKGLSGAYFEDVAGVVIGQTHASDGNTGTWTSGTKGIVLVDGGLNEAIFAGGSDSFTMAGIDQALQAILYKLMSSATVEDTDASLTYTGTWSTNAYPWASAGSVHLTSTVNDKVDIAVNGTDFVVLSAAFGQGVLAPTQYTKKIDAGAAVAKTIPNVAAATHLGQNSCNAAIPFTGMSAGAHTLEIVYTAGNYQFIDAVLTLTPNHPTIIVVKPVYVTFSGTGHGTNGDIDTVRAQIDTTVATVKAAYPAAQIVTVDPVAQGWNENTMLGASGNHLNDFGEAWFADLIDRTALSTLTTYRNGQNSV